MTENKKARIINCIEKKLQKTSDSLFFTRSRDIAEQTGLSPREVGSNILVIKNEIETDFKIEDYANSKATTWKVQQKI